MITENIKALVIEFKNGTKIHALSSNPKGFRSKGGKVVLDVLSDIISTVAGNQYGGLTVPQIDEILIPYCEKSYIKFTKEYEELVNDVCGSYDAKKADEYAYKKISRDIAQRLQGIEHTFNSVSSSRGDFPFITFTFGHSTNRWAKLVSEEILKVRMGTRQAW